MTDLSTRLERAAETASTETRERPIIFTGPSVRAIQAGTKTMTRRVVKPQPPESYDWSTWETKDTYAWCESHPLDGGPRHSVRCPYGKVGDRLRVNEAWQAWRKTSHEYDEWEPLTREWLTDHCLPNINAAYDEGYVNSVEYRATSESVGPWRSPRFMPRWASRIWLEITSLRVERVQEITEADAIAEGIEPQEGGGTGPGPGFKWHGAGYHAGSFDVNGQKTYHVARVKDGPCSCVVGGPSPAQCAFREVWDSINGKCPGCSWTDNPWVWVIEFKRIKP